MAKLEDYSFGRITVDGEEQTRDLGAHGRRRPTAEAVRRYGKSDARRMAAALHLTC